MMRSMLCAVAITVLAICFGRVPEAQAQGRDPFNDQVVLDIVHLNFDCAQDTIWGVMAANLQYVPTQISWGQGDSSCTVDTALVPTTRIRLPDWQNLKGSLAIQRMNEDTLSDLVVYVWGEINRSGVVRDTMRAIVIFGQDAISRRSSISIDSIPRHRSSPYFAMELVRNDHFTRGKRRDMSGRMSWILSMLEQDVREQEEDSSRGAPITSGVEEPWIHVYPNPSVYSTTVEVKNIPPGHYRVAVIATNGQRVLDRDVHVGARQEILEVLNLQDLSSGYYVLEIHRGPQRIGAYPIVIVK